MDKALVVFGADNAHPLSWLLKKGFEHCFLCIQSGDYWVELDQINYKFDVRVSAHRDFDLASHYRDHGYIVVETSSQSKNTWKLNPFYGNIMIANCVGLVKAALSIHSLALTPYQLYKRLTKWQGSTKQFQKS